MFSQKQFLREVVKSWFRKVSLDPISSEMIIYTCQTLTKILTLLPQNIHPTCPEKNAFTHYDISGMNIWLFACSQKQFLQKLSKADSEKFLSQGRKSPPLLYKISIFSIKLWIVLASHTHLKMFMICVFSVSPQSCQEPIQKNFLALISSVWRYPKSERNRIRNFFPIPNFSDTESDTFFDT